jgi:SulP family sulfate permease
VAVLLFLTRPLEKVPTAALAAVVIGAVLRLIEVGSLRRLWRTRRIEFVIAIATTSAAVAIGLLEGIVTGVALSVGDSLVRAARRQLSRAHGEGGRAANARLAPAPGTAVYRASGPVIFANAHRLREGARRAAAEAPGAYRLVVDASEVVDIDATAAETLADLRDDLAARGIELVLSGLNPRVRGVLDRADVPDRPPPAPVVDPAGSRPA